MTIIGRLLFLASFAMPVLAWLLICNAVNFFFRIVRPQNGTYQEKGDQ